MYMFLYIYIKKIFNILTWLLVEELISKAVVIFLQVFTRSNVILDKYLQHT